MFELWRVFNFRIFGTQYIYTSYGVHRKILPVWKRSGRWYCDHIFSSNQTSRLDENLAQTLDGCDNYKWEAYLCKGSMGKVVE